MATMMDICQDPLTYLVEQLCCRVYLDGGGNVRLGFSRRHDLKDMMTAQGIARSNAGLLRDRLRQAQSAAGLPAEGGVEDARVVDRIVAGAFCPLI